MKNKQPDIKPRRLISVLVAGIHVRGERLRPLSPPLVDKLAASMREHGQEVPIIVREIKHRGGCGYYLVAGLHRLEAAKRLGWEAIDCEYVDGMTEEEAKLTEIIENLERGELEPDEVIAHRKALTALELKRDPTQPDQVIADKVKLTREVVKRIRGKLFKGAPDHQNIRVRKDGRTQTVGDTRARNRQKIIETLKADPEKSTVVTAEELGIPRVTVQKVRHKAEVSGEIPQTTTRRRRDGVPARNIKPVKVTPKPVPPSPGEIAWLQISKVLDGLDTAAYEFVKHRWREYTGGSRLRVVK